MTATFAIMKCIVAIVFLVLAGVNAFGNYFQKGICIHNKQNEVILDAELPCNGKVSTSKPNCCTKLKKASQPTNSHKENSKSNCCDNAVCQMGCCKVVAFIGGFCEILQSSTLLTTVNYCNYIERLQLTFIELVSPPPNC